MNDMTEWNEYTSRLKENHELIDGLIPDIYNELDKLIAEISIIEGEHDKTFNAKNKKLNKNQRSIEYEQSRDYIDKFKKYTDTVKQGLDEYVVLQEKLSSSILNPKELKNIASDKLIAEISIIEGEHDKTFNAKNKKLNKDQRSIEYEQSRDYIDKIKKYTDTVKQGLDEYVVLQEKLSSSILTPKELKNIASDMMIAYEKVAKSIRNYPYITSSLHRALRGFTPDVAEMILKSKELTLEFHTSLAEIRYSSGEISYALDYFKKNITKVEDDFFIELLNKTINAFNGNGDIVQVLDNNKIFNNPIIIIEPLI